MVAEQLLETIYIALLFLSPLLHREFGLGAVLVLFWLLAI
jgi:hypothetical protein